VPYDEDISERIRRVLANRRDVVEKKMMGGLCFMLDGRMCCGVVGSALMVRVGREDYQAALAQPHVRPLEFGGRRPSGFVLVDPAGVSTARTLESWVKRGVDFVATLD
jgi:TfoX/Sxy family transcriptional regulator of competence genes